MRITITKGAGEDRIDAVRPDGSSASTTFPHKGPIPHDAVHFFVESELGISDGFWGLVAAGRHPEEVQDIAKAGGHASAGRAQVPEAAIVRIIQAERTVECFEADLWGGSQGDPQTFRDVVHAGCAQSLVPPLEVPDAAIARIRAHLLDLRQRWSALGEGQGITLDWTEATA